MFDFRLMEEQAEIAMAPLSARECQLLRFLEEERAAQASFSLRRRLAAGIVRLGLRLDPEALSIGSPRVALESGNVRD